MPEHYLSKKTMNRIVAECQKANTLTDDMVHAVRLIVHGILSKYGSNADEDALHSDVCLAVFTHIHSLNTKKNLFSYITTIAMNTHRANWRKDEMRTRALKGIAKRMVNGEQNPDAKRRMDEMYRQKYEDGGASDRD